MKVFWPKRALRRFSGDLIGWQGSNHVVVADVWEEEPAPSPSTCQTQQSDGQDNGPVRIGRACSDNEPLDSISKGDLTVWVDSSGLPVSCSRKIQLILYTPPDTNRLRFLTIGQEWSNENTGSESPRLTNAKSLDGYGIDTTAIADDVLGAVIPQLNAVFAVQRQGVARSRYGKGNRAHACSTPANDPVAEGMLKTEMIIIPAYLGRLCSSSATAQQLLLRLRQIWTGPAGFRATMHDPAVDLSTRNRKYNLFWNTIWLILNDLILGYCARQILLPLSSILFSSVPPLFRAHLIDMPIQALTWLNDWPVGLKLNTPLSQFFSASFGMIISVWSDIVTPHLPAILPLIILILSTASYGGLTLLLAMVTDTLNLATLHLRLCALVTRRICRWQLDSLSGLWNLFRGKRWNVLRQRTDSYAYEVDQLFLGTLFFTVSIFLLPTVLTYTALFALLELAIAACGALIAVMVTALNAFPLFEIMLRIKEPSRLPGGIGFKVLPQPPGSTSIESVLEIMNAPISFSDILGRKS